MSYALGVIAAKKEEERERKALRDYFAGLAMQGVLAGTSTPDSLWSAQDVSGIAYKVADAMLAEREKGDE